MVPDLREKIEDRMGLQTSYGAGLSSVWQSVNDIFDPFPSRCRMGLEGRSRTPQKIHQVPLHLLSVNMGTM